MLRTHLPSKVKLIATDLNGADVPAGRCQVWQERRGCDGWKLTRVICPSLTGSSTQLCVSSESCLCRTRLTLRAKAHRVLKRDGIFLFNVWDAMRAQQTRGARTSNYHQLLLRMTLQRSTRFLLVTTIRAEIRRILKQAGFREIKTEVIAKIGKANRAEDVARGLVEEESRSGNDCEARSFITSHNHRRRDRCDYASIWRTRYPCTNAGDCGPEPALKKSQAHCRIDVPIAARFWLYPCFGVPPHDQQPAATMGSLHDRDWRTTFLSFRSAVEESLII